VTNYDTLTEIEWDRVKKIWELLDEGEVDRARLELGALLAERPGHPDLRIVDAAVSLDEGEPRRALEALDGAEFSADPTLFFHLRAVAEFELADFAGARADAERAIAINPDFPESHHLLARTLDHLGDTEGAQRHEEMAEVLDPEAFPAPFEISDAEFDSIVEVSLRDLPPPVRKQLEDLPVWVEPLPTSTLLTAEDPPLSPDLLGLFVGRHLLERSHADLPSAPGAIYLFRRNLLRACADREELAREVRITVLHEVGHLLGLDEDDLEQWGLA
jgi:predicted Zn-dependent protease with MMP-like domain